MQNHKRWQNKNVIGHTHIHDGCVMTSFHQDDDRFSWTSWGILGAAIAMCVLRYNDTNNDTWYMVDTTFRCI